MGQDTAFGESSVGVFSRQWDRWREFRRRQRITRSHDLASQDNFGPFLDEARQYHELAGEPEAATDPDFESIIQDEWKLEQRSRRSLQKRLEEVRSGGLIRLVEDTRRRLSKHGFSDSFDLLEDPMQQCKRTTWIEYLDFECWSLDELTRVAQAYEKKLQSGNKSRLKRRTDAVIRQSNQRLRVRWVLTKPPQAKKALALTNTRPATTEPRRQGSGRKRAC
ncbi:hypothetical protein F5Y16DRAFT_389385 [Xylariaceae sp. FL0255]|nr:hypothetical protein F5Y16DRAFT_389385 [Xylariaceae sp. FL0255]